MKLKKFFAGVVAAAMMLTMGATAAFAEGGNLTSVTNNGKGTFAIEKTYKPENAGTYAPGETFKLVQTEKSGKQMSASYNGVVPDLKVAEGEKEDSGIVGVVTFTDESSKERTGNFTIGLPEYKGVGVFTYTLQEVAATNAGIKNDERTDYIVTVYATQGEHGIETSVTVHESGKKNSKVQSINNVFQAGALTVHKDVEGQLGDKSYEFPFTVILTSEKPVTANLYVGEQKVSFKEDEKTHKYTATVTFSLKDGQEFTIGNIPYGVDYVVSEDNVTTNDKGDKELTVGSGENAVKYTVEYDNTSASITAATAKATVTNTAGNVTIDTGVILDNAPYIALLAIVAFGGVALILNKRRRDEE